MDIAPNQITSIAASLFVLEHDDANRCADGFEHATPGCAITAPEAPIVGTGLEGRVAKDSRTLINAEGNGVVEYVDANEIRIKYDRDETDRLSHSTATVRAIF